MSAPPPLQRNRSHLRSLFPAVYVHALSLVSELTRSYAWIGGSCSTGLVRTRDPSTLATCDIVVDVGGVYDPSKHRYDHHQRGFDEVFGNGFNTKLSSAGLIYKLVYSILLVGPSIYSTWFTRGILEKKLLPG